MYLIPERHLTPGSGETFTCKTKGSDRWSLRSSPSMMYFLAVWILTRSCLWWKLSADAKAVPGGGGIIVPRPPWAEAWGWVHGDVSGLWIRCRRKGSAHLWLRPALQQNFPYFQAASGSNQEGLKGDGEQVALGTPGRADTNLIPPGGKEESKGGCKKS